MDLLRVQQRAALVTGGERVAKEDRGGEVAGVSGLSCFYRGEWV